jgi:hypothetical protein
VISASVQYCDIAQEDIIFKRKIFPFWSTKWRFEVLTG